MTQFHDGQEVEVRSETYRDDEARQWRKAVIVEYQGRIYSCRFPNGTRAVFAADYIRVARQAV